MLLPEEIIKDKTLSTRAKGLYALINNLQADDLQISRKMILNYVSGFKSTVDTAIKELKNHGYLKIIEARDENGRIAYFYELR